MIPPLVSIIIPTYNRAHLIGETLESVLAQTYENWECIIVDDGSTDSTSEVLAEYANRDSRFQYHHRPPDRIKGANACRNYGFEMCKGEYVNWFDDDDVMLNDFLKVKVEIFTPKLQLVIVSGYYVNEKLQDQKAIILNEAADLFKEYVLWKLQILTPSILFRKNFLIDKELFHNKIHRGQETELFSRLFFKLSTNSYRIINEPLFFYRQHAATKSYENEKYIKEYKESQTYIAFEIFKKAIEINELELIYHSYRTLIGYFFKGIENNHSNNSRLILMNLISILKKSNKVLTLELILIGELTLVVNRRIYFIEKRLKFYSIKKIN